MLESPQIPRFFLGANSVNGFYSIFEKAYSPNDGWRAIFLKGGPGTGKSTLMKRLAQAMLDSGVKIELDYCSADPHSLDAVIIPEKKLFIADATAPHVLEPKFSGSCESMIDLGSCWDSEKLYSRRERIMELNSQVASQHRRSRRFISAAGELLKENMLLAEENLDYVALETYSHRLAKRLLPKKRLGIGKKSFRFLSAVTPLGLTRFDPSLLTYAKNVIFIDDEYGAASSFLLNRLSEYALQSGFSVICCPCPLFPKEKLDALIIPDANLAFAVSGTFHQLDIEPLRILHLRRFLDMKHFSENLTKIRVCRKFAKDLLSNSVSALGEALELHDSLEKIYMSAMDYSKSDLITDTLIRDIRMSL